MLRSTPKSLNALSYEAVIEMLETIRDISPLPPTVQHVFVDTVGDPGFYKNKLLEVCRRHCYVHAVHRPVFTSNELFM